MRLTKREVKSIEEIRAVIDSCDVCRIGLADDGVPYIVPMNFGYEFGGEESPESERLTLWFHCATEGRKLDLIAGGCNAGFEMDTRHELISAENACDYSMNYASLIGSGRISKVTDDDEKLHGLKVLMSHYGGEGRPFNESVIARTCVLRLDAAEFACKRLKK
jgi:nitroimidazol reductase NimA-like FMN-containing flavoprotein (pyridoxamine 5'-phosphate oxidase superfamily)